jgi:O-antigen/teichoic acid export membrane protein
VSGTDNRAPGVLTSFSSLLAAQVVGAVLGLAFWVTVAQLLEPEVIGVAAAAINTQTLLGSLMTLGLGTLFIAELPLLGSTGQRRLVWRGLTIISVGSLLVGLAIAFVAGTMGPSLREALDTPVEDLVFAFGVAGTAVALVVDQAGLGLRKARLQVIRNLLASGLRFPVVGALLLAGYLDPLGLQIAWIAPLWFSVAVSLYRLHLGRPGPDEPDEDPAPPLTRQGRYYAVSAARNHLLSIALAAGTTLIPVIAAITLAKADNASFAIAWLLASFIFLPPYLLATALFAHGANASADDFRETMSETVPAAMALSGLLLVGSWVLGKPVLAIFGSHYSETSWALLSLLAPAGLWMVVKDHLVAFCRAQKQFRLGVALTMVSVVMELTGAAIGAALGGGIGLCIGWLCAQALEVIVYTPFLRRNFGGIRYRSPLAILRSRR